MKGGWFCAGLQMNRADNVQAESLRQIGPSRMMGDETSVGKSLSTRGQFFLQLTQPLEVGRLIGSEFSRMSLGPPR